MKIDNIKNYIKGWFCGDFHPRLIHSKDIEIACHHYFAGFKSEPHIHKIATEYNLIINGLVEIEDKLFKSGDFFIFEPNKYKQVKFIYDTDLIIIKTPSIIGDKYPC